MLPTAVRIFRSTDTGAPVLRGQVGDMIALLDACLVNGYGAGTVTSITRSGSTATATRTAHLYAEHDVIEHSGANQTEYNGAFKIFNVTANTYDFEVTGTPVTPATGTISGKKPKAGFSKEFSGTNLAVYRADDAASTRLRLRVDDTTTTHATIKAYETMSDVNTGTGPYPGTLHYWVKSINADTASRLWALVSDGFIFYLFVAHNSVNNLGYSLYAFGDVLSLRQGDAYHCILIGMNSNTASLSPGTQSQGPLLSGYHVSPTYPGTQTLARSYTQLGGAVDVAKIALGFAGSIHAIGYGSNQLLGYPHIVDNSLVAVPVMLSESLTAIRGAMPGYFAPLHINPGTRLSILGDWPALPGRKVWLFPQGNGNSSANFEGRCLIDLTGPWR